MANCPLTLRITKGSKLTFAELDGNFISLANCINSLPQYDSFVTGGTYNTLTNSIDFTGNFDFVPFSTDLSYLANTDITVTGGTYDSSTGVVTFYNNSGGTFQVSGFLTGYTNYYTTGVTLNNTTLEFDRTDLSNAYSVDLSSLIFTGNTSGDCITDLYISNLYGCSPITIHDNLILESGVTISTSNGGGQIELDYALQPSNILISTDNGGGTESFINLQQTELNLSSLNGDVRIQSSTSNDFRSGGFFSNKSQILMEPDFVKIGVVDPFAVFSNDYESVVVYNTLSSDQSTSNANKWPVIVSSKNSTVLSGVRNSVILGGQGITASTNDTVYVDNLNINNVGGGTSLINLGLDVNGNVVTGTTGGDTFTGGTVPGETIFSSGLSATTISATTIGSPTSCVSDLYASNIHSCSPLNINPLDEGNVYFGSTSAVTIDLSNNRVGIGTNTPQYPLQILGSNSTFYYDPNSVGGRFNVSGSTNIPRYDISIASYLTKPATGGSVGMRTWDDSLWSAYGKVGDMFMYAGNATNGLNIINGPGTGTEDYIKFYAGQTATGSADLHIQGSGSTRGYVGIGTESPTQKLHVNGSALINGSLSAGTTSLLSTTATTLSTETVTVTNTTGTPSQAASFDVNGKLVAGLGQTTYSAFGSSTLSVTSSVTTFTLIPGLTQTITVPTNCNVLISTDGGINTTSTSTTSIAAVDIAIFIDGSYPTNGGYRRLSAHNPSGTGVNNTGVGWGISTIQNLSAGTHTIEVRAVYGVGSTTSVSGNNTTARQGSLYISILKN